MIAGLPKGKGGAIGGARGEAAMPVATSKQDMVLERDITPE